MMQLELKCQKGTGEKPSRKVQIILAKRQKEVRFKGIGLLRRYGGSGGSKGDKGQKGELGADGGSGADILIQKGQRTGRCSR